MINWSSGISVQAAKKKNKQDQIKISLEQKQTQNLLNKLH